jgi:hypothetical protein
LIVLGLAGICMAAPKAGAARFSNLYQVTVAPDRAGPDQGADAIQLAMAKLLTRVTGKRDASIDPQLQALMADPAPYLNRFGSDLQGQPVVTFNARRVDEALTSLNWPVWGPERPLTLLWIAVDDGRGERALLSANELGAELSAAMATLLADIRAELAAVADERGLPIVLPLLDLEDLTAVSFADVWGGFEERVELGSARYRADAILLGRVRPGAFGNEVQWLLLKDGARRPLAGISVRDGLEAVANLYAADFAVVGGTSTAQITILDVVSLGDYGRVMSYLETLSVLQTVEVESLDRGVLTLRVAARGDARLLERVLALGGVLNPPNAVGSPGTSAGALVFQIARPETAR